MNEIISELAVGLMLEMLLAGFAEKPDSRKRRGLVQLAGTVAYNLDLFATEHVEALNSLLIRVFKALEDPSVCRFPCFPFLGIQLFHIRIQ